MVGNALEQEAVMEDEVMGLSELQTSATHSHDAYGTK